MNIDKQILKATMVSLEHDVINQAEQAYQAFVEGVFYDREQTVEFDDQAQAVANRNLADQVEERVHEHEDHVAQLEAIPFDAKTTVEPGAVVKLSESNRYLVVAVPTAAFVCEGVDYLGISVEAPLYRAIEGLQAGDTFEFADRDRVVERVF